MRKNRRQAVVTVTTFSSDYTIQELYYGIAGGMVPRGRLLTVADTVGEQIRAMQSMNAPFPYSAVRDKILRVVGKELIGKLVVYASDQTHSTLQKAFQENKGAKFSKYELISSAIAGLTLQSLYLRWFKLRGPDQSRFTDLMQKTGLRAVRSVQAQYRDLYWIRLAQSLRVGTLATIAVVGWGQEGMGLLMIRGVDDRGFIPISVLGMGLEGTKNVNRIALDLHDERGNTWNGLKDEGNKEAEVVTLRSGKRMAGPPPSMGGQAAVTSPEKAKSKRKGSRTEENRKLANHGILIEIEKKDGNQMDGPSMTVENSSTEQTASEEGKIEKEDVHTVRKEVAFADAPEEIETTGVLKPPWERDFKVTDASNVASVSGVKPVDDGKIIGEEGSQGACENASKGKAVAKMEIKNEGGIKSDVPKQ
nr:tyrosine decarboxylase 1 [Ipomoea batatas]